MRSQNSPILKAKENLRTVLAERHSISDHPKVSEAIESLIEVWKKEDSTITSPPYQASAAPARSELLLGEWRSLSASKYPDRIEKPGEPGIFQYTLGRLSFNIFQPKKLVCTVNEVFNVVSKIEDDQQKDDNVIASYNNVIELTAHTDEGDLPAEICMDGRCSTKSDERLEVVFTAGELRKGAAVQSDKKLLALWEKTFEGAYAKAEKEKGFKESILQWLVKSMLNMTMPTDECAKYEMKRPMKGYVDVLYLDEDLRITRGNYGSIVIVERVTE
uniref:Plastid lipid-associated protein/fibrillin conserved domain-containing protein n=1 Tax=Helicotheca tamesis TaxID=374047 RepID=A0A7S2MET0_9STRA